MPAGGCVTLAGDVSPVRGAHDQPVNEETQSIGVERPSREYALICVECRTISRPGALGWRMYLDVEGDLATYCPGCAAHEFGD